MNKFIITEEEKKHIMGLYEQKEKGFKEKVRNFFDKLFNTDSINGYILNKYKKSLLFVITSVR
jgi:hypothetical protein